MWRCCQAPGIGFAEASLLHLFSWRLLFFCILLAALARPVPALSRLGSDRGISLYGVAIGFFVGVESVGSGSLLAHLLLILNKTRPANVVGTDVCHAAILAMVTAPVHIKSGHVAWGLLPPMVSGAIPGTLLGSRLVRKVPPQLLRVALATVLLVSAYLMA